MRRTQGRGVSCTVFFPKEEEKKSRVISKLNKYSILKENAYIIYWLYKKENSINILNLKKSVTSRLESLVALKGRSKGW